MLTQGNPQRPVVGVSSMMTPSEQQQQQQPGSVSPALNSFRRNVEVTLTSNGNANPNQSLSNGNAGNNRPVSVHGNLIHNNRIYANVTVPSKMTNGGLNLSTSAPTQINLNRSSSNNVSPSQATRTTLMDSSSSHHDLNTTQISPINSRHIQHNRTNSNLNSTKQRLNASLMPANVTKFMTLSKEAGVKEMITSLAVLCLVSLLLALLSLVFLMKISPASQSDSELLDRKGFAAVYEVTLALCALALSLNLCCLLVCAIQFLFAVKLVKSAQGKVR